MGGAGHTADYYYVTHSRRIGREQHSISVSGNRILPCKNNDAWNATIPGIIGPYTVTLHIVNADSLAFDCCRRFCFPEAGIANRLIYDIIPAIFGEAAFKINGLALLHVS